MQQLTITTQTGRIDFVLTEAFQISRSQAQSLLKKQLVRVNNHVVKAKYSVQKDDIVTIHPIEPQNYVLNAENLPLDIIHEDDAVVVVNKASGMVVHPSLSHSNGTLVNALLYHVKNLATISGENRPGIVHRIDKETSGLLVVAKNNDAHQWLAQQLETHTIQREYIALVHGVIENERGTIDAPLARDKKNRLKRTVQEGGKRAVTHFKVIQRFEKYTLIQLTLETGRTHQIRSHMHFIGFDIVGDPLYSHHQDDKTNGQLLHAKTLTFIHPITKETVTYEAPLPDFFTQFLQMI